MNLLWLILIIPAGIFALLFTIYILNLDMKLVSVIYKWLNKRFDNMKKESKL